jgi:hypothetical protein
MEVKTIKTEEPKAKNKNYWQIPLNNVRVFNYPAENPEKTDSNLLKNMDEMELYQEWKNNNFDISFKEGKVNNMPNDFRELFESNDIVRNAFEKLPEHHKRQYILWVESSLNEDIRQERIERLVRIFSQRFNSL